MDGLPHASEDAVAHLFSLESPQRTLTEFLCTGTFDEPALRQEIEALFAPGLGEEAGAFAASFVEAVKRTGHKAAASDRDAMRFTARSAAKELVLPELEQIASAQDELRAAVEDLRDHRPVPAASSRQIGLLLGRQLGLDVEEILRELAAADSAGAAALLDHLAGTNPDAASLVTAPPGWAESGTAGLWFAIGRLNVVDGRWEMAESAFARAEGVPGADRASALTRACECARLAGSEDRAQEYLERARAIAPARVNVRLAEINTLADAAERIAARDGLTAGNERERAAILTAQADDHAETGRFDQAVTYVETLLSEAPSSLAGLDRRAGLELILVKRRVGDGLGPDVEVLRRVVADSLSARERVPSRARARESGGLLARAVEASVLAGDRARALELLRETPTAHERADRDVRRELAGAAIYADALEDVLGLLGPEEQWDAQDRHIASHALLLQENPEAVARGNRLAARLFAEDPESASAAFALAASASQDASLPWSEEAISVLAADEPAVAAVVKAERLATEGHPEQAAVLLSRYPASVPALRSLTDLALGRGEWARARVLAERLVKATGRGDDVMRRACALRGLGEIPALMVELRALIADPAVPDGLRARACNALTEQLHGSDLTALAEVSRT